MRHLIACTSHFGALHAAGLAQVTFLAQLHDATVVEGGNAYSILPNQTTTVLEGEDITYTFGLDANPTPTNFTWYRDGQVIPSGGRIAVLCETWVLTAVCVQFALLVACTRAHSLFHWTNT